MFLVKFITRKRQMHLWTNLQKKRNNFLRILGSLKGIFQAQHVDPPEDDVV